MKRSYNDYSTQQQPAPLSSFFPDNLRPHSNNNLYHHDQQQSAYSHPNPILQSFHFLQPENSIDETPTSPTPLNHGESIETTRRPRGRPPGSKNKPKPLKEEKELQQPLSLPHSATMRSRIFQIPTGVDIVEALSTFARNRALGICVLAGSGAVSDVTIKQGGSSTVTLRGQFDILSLSAVFVAKNNDGRVLNAAITLAGPQGQVVGGSLAGALISSGTVYITAGSFSSTSHHRLPEVENRAADETGSLQGEE